MRGFYTKVLLTCFLIAGLALTILNLLEKSLPEAVGSGSLSYIDTHNHLSGRFTSPSETAGLDYDGAAQVALATMDKLGIQKLFILPPPFPPDFRSSYDADDLVGIVKKYPDRFAFLAGGGTLNVMIQQAIQSGNTSAEMQIKFEQKALELLSKGALGFGELTAEHLSLAPDHPYLSAPPDHPLFLLLADIAARYDVPIDIHMEAIPEEMPLPQGLRSPPNPAILKPNIAAFERLLAHNRKAKIIWVHAGWDNTGRRTAALCSELLTKHSNLYMSLKIGPDSPRVNRPTNNQGQIEAAWFDLIRAFPERFLLGSDQFYVSPKIPLSFPRSVEGTLAFIAQLPPELLRKVGSENAKRVYKLDK